MSRGDETNVYMLIYIVYIASRPGEEICDRELNYARPLQTRALSRSTYICTYWNDSCTRSAPALTYAYSMFGPCALCKLHHHNTCFLRNPFCKWKRATYIHRRKDNNQHVLNSRVSGCTYVFFWAIVSVGLPDLHRGRRKKVFYCN